MKTFRSIEKQAHLLGLPMTDLFALLFVMSLAIVLGIVLNFMIPMSKYYFWGIILLAGLSYLLLKRLNRKKHPSRLFSYLSYRFWQPRHLRLRRPETGIRRPKRKKLGAGSTELGVVPLGKHNPSFPNQVPSHQVI